MTVAFWLIAAALIAAVVAALARPLWRTAGERPSPDARASNVGILREQLAELDAERASGAIDAAQFGAAKAELERRVLEEAERVDPAPARTTSRASAITLALLVPVLAIGLYAVLGNRGGLDPLLAQAPAAATPEDIETLVERLAERMRDQPDDPEGWALLGRVYSRMERFELARDALSKAVALRTGDAQLLADYADALAMTQGRTLIGQPQALIEQALQADPQNLKALALAGSAAMERRDFTAAIDYWTKARAVAPDGSPFAAGIEQSLADARTAAGLPNDGVKAAAAINGKVTIAPALAARVQPGDTLFVFARAADSDTGGPRMPLAIQRGTVGGVWPIGFTLDDSMAMAPQLKLSAFDRVIIGARISRSGDATPQPGDLEGHSGPLTPGAAAVTVSIDRVRE